MVDVQMGVAIIDLLTNFPFLSMGCKLLKARTFRYEQ
jgi:hypothetical protein